jgi:hypothetical protein
VPNLLRVCRRVKMVETSARILSDHRRVELCSDRSLSSGSSSEVGARNLSDTCLSSSLSGEVKLVGTSARILSDTSSSGEVGRNECTHPLRQKFVVRFVE